MTEDDYDATLWAAMLLLLGLPLTWLVKEAFMKCFIAACGNEENVEEDTGDEEQAQEEDEVLQDNCLRYIIEHENNPAKTNCYRKSKFLSNLEHNYAQIDDDDLARTLAFVVVMVRIIEKEEENEGPQDESSAENKDLSRRLFDEIHNTAAWSENARTIFDMGHLLFDSKVKMCFRYYLVTWVPRNYSLK